MATTPTSWSLLLESLTKYQGGDSTGFPDYGSWIGQFEAWFNRNARLREMEASVQLTLAASEVGLPADYIAWRAVEWLGATPDRELKWIHPKYIEVDYPSLLGEVEFFTIENGVLTVIPEDPNDNDIVLRYWQKLVGLGTDELETNWLSLSHPDLYLAGSMYEGAMYSRDLEGMAVWKAKRDEIFGELVRLSAYTQGADAIRSNEYF